MSEMCFIMDCKDCKWHVIRNDKLDCNKDNRLETGKLRLAEVVEEEIEDAEEGA